MPDPFIAFLEKPAGETFSALRDAVIAAPEYDFYSNDLTELEALAARGDLDLVVERLPSAMPNWLLSPRAHQLFSRAAEQTGDADLAQRENYLMKACLRGLAESGDGTAQRPYLVTHVSDEYDLLAALNKEVAQQRQVSNERGLFDVILCTDGSELWFDVSSSLTTPSFT